MHYVWADSSLTATVEFNRKLPEHKISGDVYRTQAHTYARAIVYEGSLMTPTTTSPNITPEQIIEHIQTKGQLSLTPWQIELIHRLRTDPVMGTAITARPSIMSLIQKAIKEAIRDISAGKGTKN